MDELTSRTARCSSVASRCSTIAASPPPGARSTRPYCFESAGSKERTVAAASFTSMRLDELAQHLRGQQRRVSREDEDVVHPTLELGASAAHGIAGAERLLLHCDRQSVERCRVVGAATTTSGSAPSAREDSSTQSTIRRPRIGCRCFGTSERMRVPSPAAMTTAPSVLSPLDDTEAGAPGFEPGITGPKPVALPLGHAPERGSSCHSRAIARLGRARDERSADVREGIRSP